MLHTFHVSVRVLSHR